MKDIKCCYCWKVIDPSHPFYSDFHSQERYCSLKCSVAMGCDPNKLRLVKTLIESQEVL